MKEGNLVVHKTAAKEHLCNVELGRVAYLVYLRSAQEQDNNSLRKRMPLWMKMRKKRLYSGKNLELKLTVQLNHLENQPK